MIFRYTIKNKTYNRKKFAETKRKTDIAQNILLPCEKGHSYHTKYSTFSQQLESKTNLLPMIRTVQLFIAENYFRENSAFSLIIFNFLHVLCHFFIRRFTFSALRIHFGNIRSLFRNKTHIFFYSIADSVGTTQAYVRELNLKPRQCNSDSISY